MTDEISDTDRNNICIAASQTLFQSAFAKQDALYLADALDICIGRLFVGARHPDGLLPHECRETLRQIGALK